MLHSPITRSVSGPPGAAARGPMFATNESGATAFMVRPTVAPPPIEPLSPEDLEEATQIASRMRERLDALLHALPQGTRGATAVSRFLGVDRTACQRLLGALPAQVPAPATLTQVAGVRSLMQIVQAARGRGLDESVVAGFEGAVRQFGVFLDRIGGSQRVLADRLKATGPGAGAADSPEALPNDDPGLADRIQVFDAARRLIGRWCRVHLTMSIAGPSSTEPGMYTTVTVRGSLGHRQLPAAVPLVLTQKWTASDSTFLAEEGAAGLNSGALLAEFCSKPVPNVTTTADGADLMHLVEPVDRAAPFDVIFAFRAGVPESAFNPSELCSSIAESWSMVNHPAESMLFDVFHHRDLAQRSIPGMTAQLWNVNVTSVAGDHWETRVPNPPRLQVLGPGLSQADSRLHPRHRELLERLFRESGWDPEDFVGYRCEMAYPAWRLAYRFYADFRRTEPRGAG